MTPENQELLDWIAYDQSDLAQRVREAVRPTPTRLAFTVNDFARWGERFDHRHIMRRKVRKLQ